MSKSTICPDFANNENCSFWYPFHGQYLDKNWISICYLCPRSFQLDRNSTHSRQTLSLYLSVWTDIRQGLDIDLTYIGFCIQSLSNQPIIRSTKKTTKNTGSINILMSMKINWHLQNTRKLDKMRFPGGLNSQLHGVHNKRYQMHWRIQHETDSFWTAKKKQKATLETMSVSKVWSGKSFSLSSFF